MVICEVTWSCCFLRPGVQSAAILEAVFTDAYYSIGHDDLSELTAGIEGKLSDPFQGARDDDLCEGIAVVEGIFAYFGNPLIDNDPFDEILVGIPRGKIIVHSSVARNAENGVSNSPGQDVSADTLCVYRVERHRIELIIIHDYPSLKYMIYISSLSAQSCASVTTKIFQRYFLGIVQYQLKHNCSL